MNFYIIVLSICLFVSLFLIYTLSKEDFILLRKDISMDKLFNFIFLIFIVGLFSSRVIYAIIYSPRMFLNPLLFLLFPYFPGLSLIGGVLGGLAFFLFYSRSKNLPMGRIVDFFALGFLSSLPLGYLGYFLLSGGKNLFPIIIGLIYILLSFIFLKYFLELLSKGVLKDGSLALIFLILFSLITLTQKIIEGFLKLAFIKQPENYLILFLLIISVFIFIRNERIIRVKRR